MTNANRGKYASIGGTQRRLKLWAVQIPHGCYWKGTNRRVSLITQEYEGKLWKYYAKFHNTPEKVARKPEPSAGPLVSRLRSFPMMKLVARPWAQ